MIAGRVLTAEEAGNELLTGDRIYLPHFEGCQCGDDIPDGGATSAAEAGADATGETTGVEQTTQDCDDDRTHFVVHSTSGVVSLAQLTTNERYKTTEIMRDADGNPILDDNGAVRSHVVSSRSKGHVYVFSDGTQYALWPITETSVWATKIESRRNPPRKGKMIHIELSYAAGGAPTEEQYQTLASLYIQANAITCKTLVIVPHIEVDRGIPNGHMDPENFDYNHFYEILRGRGVAIDDIEKFDHDRYWGHSSYRQPWADDTTSWPPVLSGNPHS